MPKLLKYTSSEVARYNGSDLVTMIDGYHQLWEADVVGKQNLIDMHMMCQGFLDNSLHLSKRQLTGNQFASLITQISNARRNGVYQYDQTTVSKLESMFCLDKQKEFTFSVSDLLTLLKNFEVISSAQSMDKIAATTVTLLSSAIKNSDKDMLELCKLLDDRGMLEDNEQLCDYIQEYVEKRFDTMDIGTVLAFAEFFKQLGLWNWNIQLML